MEFKNIVLIIVIVAMTALIGGFLLSFFDNKDIPEETNKDIEIQDYTGLIDSNENDLEENTQNEKEDTSEETEDEEINHEEIIDRVKKLDEKLLIESNFDHEVDEGVTLYDLYADKYGEKRVKQAIVQTYEVLYLLSDNSVFDEEIRDGWKEISTEAFYNRIVNRDIDGNYTFVNLIEFQIVPIESEYDGISVGLFIKSVNQGVTLFELNFDVEKNKVLLNDFKVVW